MEVVPKKPSTKGPEEMFTGDVWFDVIANQGHVRVNTVHFAPCARTDWHTNANGQTLHVLEGHGPIQTRGGKVIEIRPGDTVWTPPGEWHWHGAARDHFMTHLAIWEGLGENQEGPETTWGDPVTNTEYEEY